MNETRIAGFVVDRQLGSGATGRVYLVRNDEGQRLALKLLHGSNRRPLDADPTWLRELQAGSGVHHANVVRTLDSGVYHADGEARPFLVMEYVSGQSLRSLMAEVGKLSEDFAAYVGIEIAKALVALHRAEVVHGDLKPENVMITADERVKIMDFGASRFVADADTPALGGSLPYAAPEQIRGAAALDGRVDLYALGVILHELVAGTHPFASYEGERLARAHLTESPQSLLGRGEISAAFASVVRRLLAKDPASRFASARELIEALTSAPAPEPDRLPPVAPLIGRDVERAWLARRVDDLLAGVGQAAIVEAEVGLGKTRLAEEMIADARSRRPRPKVLMGRYLADSPSRFAAFTDAFRDYFGDEDDIGPRLERRWVSGHKIIPAFAALLRGEARDDLDERSLEQAIVETARGLAREAPSLLVIEDLQFAGRDGERFFATVARALTRERILLMATTSGGTSGLPLLPRLRIAPLDQSETELLLRHVLRSDEAAALLTPPIHDVAGGNPYITLEAVRDLQQAGTLQRGVGGGWSLRERVTRIALPKTVAALLAARLEHLDDMDRRILEVAACGAASFDAVDIAAASELAERVVRRRLAWLARVDLVQPVANGYRFAHDRTREAVAETTPPDRLRAYHRRLARLAEARDDADAVVEACEHYLRSDEPERALAYLDRAVGRLTAPARKADLLRRALDAPGLVGQTDRLRMLTRYRDAVHQMGDPVRTRLAAEECLACAEELDDAVQQAESICAIASCRRMQGEYEEALELAARAVLLSQRTSDLFLRCSTHEQLAQAQTYLGRFDAAETSLGVALSVMREAELDGTVLEVRVRGARAFLLMERGDYVAAIRELETCVDIARRVEQPVYESWASTSLAECYAQLGRAEEGKAFAETAHALARERGRSDQESGALRALGECLGRMGEYTAARRALARSLGMARAAQFDCEQDCACHALDQVVLAEGCLAEAIERIEERLVRADQAARTPCAHRSMVLLSHVQLALGRIDAARETCRDGLAVARQSGHRRREAAFLVAYGDVACAEQDWVAARDAYLSALQAYRELGADAGQALLGVVDVEWSRERRRLAGEFLREGARRSPALVTRVLAPLYAACCGQVQAAEAVTPLEKYEARLPVTFRLRARYLAWRAGAGRDHLERAQHWLALLRDNAPYEDRAPMVERHALYRAVVDAT